MSQTELYQVGDLILYEPPLEYCREAKTISVADNATISVGEMLEVDSGSPDYKKLAVDANACAVCLENYTNRTGAAVTKKIACLVRGGPLILRYDTLGLSGGSVKATAVAALCTAMGDTITRTEVGS
jgi:hypothetical protein